MKGSNESDRMKKQKKIDKDKHTDFKRLRFNKSCTQKYGEEKKMEKNTKRKRE